jgi:hypothetical protein
VLPFLCEVPEPPPEPAFVLYQDELTGFNFGQWDAPAVDDSRIYFRIAIPDTATPSAPYDTVLQVVSPNTIGWTGLAWGGDMLANPLFVAWPNCSNIVVSSRWTE